MSLTNIFNIAGSGMSAQSIRLNTVASNIANAESVSSSMDTTYRARQPLFAMVQEQVMAGMSGADKAVSGAGIGVLPCFIGDADPGLVPVLPSKRIVRGFWLVTHKDSQRLARVQAGKDWLADMVTRHHDVLLPE